MSRPWNTITAFGYLINPDYATVQTQNGNQTRAQWSFAFPDQRDPKNDKKTSWVRCVCWGNKADLVEKYLMDYDEDGKPVAKKGAAVSVTGTLVVEKYTDREGVQRTNVKIQVSDLRLMGTKPEGDDETTTEEVRAPRKTQQSNGGQQQKRQQPVTAAAKDPIDDVPF